MTMITSWTSGLVSMGLASAASANTAEAAAETAGALDGILTELSVLALLLCACFIADKISWPLLTGQK